MKYWRERERGGGGVIGAFCKVSGKGMRPITESGGLWDFWISNNPICYALFLDLQRFLWISSISTNFSVLF